MPVKQTIPPRQIKTGKEQLFISQVDNEIIMHADFHNA